MMQNTDKFELSLRFNVTLTFQEHCVNKLGNVKLITSVLKPRCESAEPKWLEPAQSADRVKRRCQQTQPDTRTNVPCYHQTIHDCFREVVCLLCISV